MGDTAIFVRLISSIAVLFGANLGANFLVADCRRFPYAENMLPGTIASSLAAADLGYAGIAQLIIEQQLSPGAIARLFANGISRDRGRVCAVVLLAGSTARFNAHREGWNGDLERELAIAEVGEAGFAAASKQAVKLVQNHWHEIGRSRMRTSR